MFTQKNTVLCCLMKVLRSVLIYWDRRRLPPRFYKTLLKFGIFLQKEDFIGNFLGKSMSLDEETAQKPNQEWLLSMNYFLYEIFLGFDLKGRIK